MQTLAVVMEKPEQLALRRLDLVDPGAEDVVVDIAWSGISTGTEKLLWTGAMPPFPGLGYPLVPGYESVGRVIEAGPRSGRHIGEQVFVPGSKGFRDARGLFGGAASRVVVQGARVRPVSESLGREAVLLALAATAHHAIVAEASALPDLIIGHGVLGRLIARIAVALGGKPVVWETSSLRLTGAEGYALRHPDEDQDSRYRTICDASGDASLMDRLIARLLPGGELVLAGFYHAPIQFDFAPAFLRELRLRVAAEWREPDLAAVQRLVAAGALSLDGLITHSEPFENAPSAYRTAFGDDRCLKMILEWRA
ncbi:MAG: chlorophyll synthesis pathway protein BchC [Methylobacterium sp.]|jgi:3-hydroxyethyl bacteriochlorophyllide a dehydrogenase|nr:chlorophyll synthesis pathway protein BchC [Methylobacterium sp.]